MVMSDEEPEGVAVIVIVMVIVVVIVAASTPLVGEALELKILTLGNAREASAQDKAK